MSFPRSSTDQPTSAPTFVLFREHPTKGSTVIEHSIGKTALDYHKSFLLGSSVRCDSATVRFSRFKVDTETAPLFFGVLLDTLQLNTFKQYGLLDEQVMLCDRMGQARQDFCEGGPSQEDPRTFLNVSTSNLGQLQHPLAGMVFHYDTFTSYGTNQICEAAYLCSSGIPVSFGIPDQLLGRLRDWIEP